MSEPEAVERPAPTNVIEALSRVMDELPGIGRDQRSEQGYQYRGIESITRHAQGLFAKYGVVFAPRVVGREVKAITLGGNPWTEDCLEVVYTVYGPGGRDDHIEVGPIIGLGRDNSDKGANKSMTQAFKYALIQTLCIGDQNDDPDQETHVADPQREQAPIDPDAQARAEWAARVRGLSPEQRERFRAWLDENEIPRIPAKLTDDQLAESDAELDRIVLAEAAGTPEDAEAVRLAAPDDTTPSPETPYTAVSEPAAAEPVSPEPETHTEPSGAPDVPDGTSPEFESIRAEVAAMSKLTVKSSLMERYTAEGSRLAPPKDDAEARSELVIRLADERGVPVP